jgi:hypothetical protein
MITKRMNHNECPIVMKSKTNSELRFIIADCDEVIRLQSDFNPNIGYYMDERHYAAMELANRQRKFWKVKR